MIEGLFLNYGVLGSLGSTMIEGIYFLTQGGFGLSG